MRDLKKSLIFFENWYKRTSEKEIDICIICIIINNTNDTYDEKEKIKTEQSKIRKQRVKV